MAKVLTKILTQTFNEQSFRHSRSDVIRTLKDSVGLREGDSLRLTLFHIIIDQMIKPVKLLQIGYRIYRNNHMWCGRCGIIKRERQPTVTPLHFNMQIKYMRKNEIKMVVAESRNLMEEAETLWRNSKYRT